MQSKKYWQRKYVKQLEEKLHSGEKFIFGDRIITVIVFIIFLVLGAFVLNKISHQVRLNNQTKLNFSSNEILKVVFFDVGQGDSSLISYKDKNILIDAGAGKDMVIQTSEPGKVVSEIDVGAEIIVPYLKKNNVVLEGIIISHPHSDHFGGLLSIFNAEFYPKWYIDNGFVTSHPAYYEILHIVKKKQVVYKVAKPEQKIEIDKDLYIEILAPVNEYKSEIVDRAVNNSSVVLKLVYKNFSVLFCGDIEIFAEMDLLEYKDKLKSKILKVPHHGSFTSTSLPFLDKVSPEVAIISCGKGNPFGHPHQETIEKLKNKKISIYRTDQNGMITILTDGIDYKVITEREY
jgi:competence protein ComEC